MTAKELRTRLSELGMSQLELARRLSRDPRTIRRWISGQAPIPKVVKDAIRGMSA